MNGRIISIWGSSGSGKSTLSLALAAKFAEKKRNVVIINNSKISPALKMFVPTVDVTVQQSLGTLLMSNRRDDSSVASRLVFHPESEHIAFMGRAPGDTYITYSDFEREAIVRLLNRLVSITDFIIIDADTNIMEDEVALVGLEISDARIQCVTPDNKGIIYTNATLPLFQEDKFRMKETIKVLGNAKDISPVPEVMQVLGQFDHILPYSYEVESKFIGGELLQNMNRSDGMTYEEEVSVLVERLMNADVFETEE